MAATRERYDRLYRRIEDEVHRGEFDVALRLSRRALAAARQISDQELIHKATSNLSFIYLQLGHPKRAERGLREIILRSADPLVICGAAYNLAISLRQQKRLDRATLFAEKALEQATALRHKVWLSRCHNLLGNIRLVQSDFDRALTHYRRALRNYEALPEDTRWSRVILTDNIGYCWLLKRRYRKGIGLVLQALALAEEIGSWRHIAECCQDLCFGYLKVGELDRAVEHGARALQIGEPRGYSDVVKNCYYLLGEVHGLAGDDRAATRYFDKLQALYPHLPFLREFLQTFDLSDVIALKNP